LIAAGIGRVLDLPVPEAVLVELDAALGMGEPDPEIQELLERSAGLNVGIDYLPGSLQLGAPLGSGVTQELAAEVVWFDAYLMNVDRTPRNPNLLLWHRKLWLIDHGAALYTQHGWGDNPDVIAAHAGARFPVIREHILLPIAGAIQEADERLAPRLTPGAIEGIVAAIPDDLLGDLLPFPSPERHREAYRSHLTHRLAATRGWVAEAEEARRAAT
jgi:hypothetical protein